MQNQSPAQCLNSFTISDRVRQNFLNFSICQTLERSVLMAVLWLHCVGLITKSVIINFFLSWLSRYKGPWVASQLPAQSFDKPQYFLRGSLCEYRLQVEQAAALDHISSRGWFLVNTWPTSGLITAVMWASKSSAELDHCLAAPDLPAADQTLHLKSVYCEVHLHSAHIQHANPLSTGSWFTGGIIH